MTECMEYAEMISALLDGELSPEEENRVRKHMSSCPDCAALYEQMQNMSGSVSAMPDFPEDLHAKIMESVKSAQKENASPDNVLENPYVIARKAQENAMKSKTYRIARSCIYGAACLILVGFAVGNSIGHRGSGSSSSAVAESTEMAAAYDSYDSAASAETWTKDSFSAEEEAPMTMMASGAAEMSPQLTIEQNGAASCYVLDEEQESAVRKYLSAENAAADASAENAADPAGTFEDADGSVISFSWESGDSPLICTDGVSCWQAGCTLNELLEIAE